MNADQTFRSKSSGIVAKLLGDFPIHPEDGFAIVGNLGHECAGFTKLQEIKPTVKGSRGGYGWPQWTGPRRRAYEAYCTRNRLDPASDHANYAYLFIELKGSEARAIPAVLDADSGLQKVEAFERSFLRAGVKNYSSRVQWMLIAADEWRKSGQAPAPMPVPRQRDLLVDEAAAAEQRAAKDKSTATNVGAPGGAAVTGGGLHAGVSQPDAAALLVDLLLFGFGVALVGAAIYFGLRMARQRRAVTNLRAAVAMLPAG